MRYDGDIPNMGHEWVSIFFALQKYKVFYKFTQNTFFFETPK